jgi:hypothetical protein
MIAELLALNIQGIAMNTLRPAACRLAVLAEHHLEHPASTLPYRGLLVEIFSNLYSIHTILGGWGSNSRPADYEKYDRTQHLR